MPSKKSPKKVARKKVGRPDKFHKVDLAQVKFLVEKGFTDQELCDFLKVDRATFYRWQHAHLEFRDVLNKWKDFANVRVERSLYQRACGYSHPSEEIFCAFGKVTRVATIKHYPPDPISCIFFLKNRMPEVYRDKPPDAEDEELKNAELVFQGVPKDAKAAEKFNRFFSN
jgi:hypothetical protein